MNKSRRIILISSFVGIVAVLLQSSSGAQDKTTSDDSHNLDTGEKKRVIKIQAKKFTYSPNQIEIKKGEHVVLEFTAIDFTHGFFIPDFKIRADLMPGKVITIPLNINEEGNYTFLCDNFCGSGHEEMNGNIIVTA